MNRTELTNLYLSLQTGIQVDGISTVMRMTRRSPRNFRYLGTKLFGAAEEFVAQLTIDKQLDLGNALQRSMEMYTNDCTSIMLLTGQAMCPTLNQLALRSPHAVSKLIVRNIPRPSTLNLAKTDIVAFQQPFTLPGQQMVLVRRIAAMEGQKMVSDDPLVQPFTIPPGHCWVLADNQNLEVGNEVIDSRCFGPLPYENIVGRVIYQIMDRFHHGVVENSKQASWQDKAILDCEVDIDKILDDLDKE
eukprot:TRINITY_DN8541_c0_g1_i1.p2 TRINITY_DN8541_c0_g1~~TRINITY_DN8541_c0_g1_i1.p2  ORF type:complete len:246 (-),score=24.75 TRINITY_DN8541_c0_g1_i1:315-1052(-)